MRTSRRRDQNAATEHDDFQALLVTQIFDDATARMLRELELLRAYARQLVGLDAHGLGCRLLFP